MKKVNQGVLILSCAWRRKPLNVFGTKYMDNMYNLQIWYFSYKQLSIVFLLDSIEFEPPNFASFDDDTSDIFSIFFMTHLNNLLIQNDWFSNWSRVAVLETLMIFCSIWPIEKFGVVWAWDVIDCNQNGVFIKTICIPPLLKFEISNFERRSDCHNFLVPWRLRKAGRVWCGGTRETRELPWHRANC